MIRVFSGPLIAPPVNTVVFDTGPITAGGDVDLGSLLVSVDGPANLRLELRNAANDANVASFMFVVANDVKVFDVNTYTFPLQPNERLRLVLTSAGVRFMQASMTYQIAKRVTVSQSGPGTLVLAAAVSGQKHKVLGFYIAPMDGNGMNWRFTSGLAPGTDLTGAAYVEKATVLALSAGVPYVVTGAGENLNLITTGTGARGVVIYATES